MVFSFSFIFFTNFNGANSEDPGQTPHFYVYIVCICPTKRMLDLYDGLDGI